MIGLRRVLFLMLVFISMDMQGQDAVFSQFMTNPIYLNPALAGQYNGTYRISGNYRDQWLGALDNPYHTFAFSGDLRYDIGGKFSSKPDIASFGFLFIADKTNLFDLNTNQIGITGTYSKYLDGRNDQYLSIGFQAGLIQKAVNYENITFQDQYNAINDYTLATGEDLPVNNFAVFDLKIGLNYSISPSDRTQYMIGASYGHITSPNISFYNNDQSPNPELIKKEALDPKLTTYVSADYKVGYLTNIQPRIVAYLQGDHFQSMLGSNFKFTISKPKRSYFHAGALVRVKNDIDGFSPQAIIISTGYEVKDFIFGLSYDHGINDLLNDRAGMNTIELSFQYFGEAEDSEDTCPKF